MAKSSKTFNSILQLIETFPDEKACVAHLAQLRWNGKPLCPYCNNPKIYKFSSGKKFKCAGCRQIFSIRVGTIFEDSNVPLRKWFISIYLETAHKKGISSYQLHRDIQVTQKTAWHMLHRIREMLRNKSPKKLQGIVEADETVIGGLEINKHANKRTPGTQGRSNKKKSSVAGALERGGEVRVEPVADTTASSLHPFIESNVANQSILYTDTWKGYNGLKLDYNHSKVNHSTGEYVRGYVHTNSIENFWSLLSRGIIGIYHHVSPKHLGRYCDEFAFRFNTRKQTEENRFNLALSKCEGNLSYKKLTRK